MDIRKRISKLKSSAKARGLEVRIMNYEYENLLNQGCHYCGVNLDNMGGVCLDRIDSRRGYVLSNVVPCCKICNIAKNDMNVCDFFDWVRTAFLHQNEMIERVRTMQNTGIYNDYNYHDEKRFHKEVATNIENKFCVKVTLSEEEKRPEKKTVFLNNFILKIHINFRI